jgi:hypothetical protein
MSRDKKRAADIALPYSVTTPKPITLMATTSSGPSIATIVSCPLDPPLAELYCWICGCFFPKIATRCGAQWIATLFGSSEEDRPMKQATISAARRRKHDWQTSTNENILPEVENLETMLGKVPGSGSARRRARGRRPWHWSAFWLWRAVQHREREESPREKIFIIRGP